MAAELMDLTKQFILDDDENNTEDELVDLEELLPTE